MLYQLHMNAVLIEILIQIVLGFQAPNIYSLPLYKW